MFPVNYCVSCFMAGIQDMSRHLFLFHGVCKTISLDSRLEMVLSVISLVYFCDAFSTEPFSLHEP